MSSSSADVEERDICQNPHSTAFAKHRGSSHLEVYQG